jgi:RNA polymerase sigma factor (sigma-70 family)
VAGTTELVAAAAAGDREAWNALVERYAGLVWSVTRSWRLDDADAGDAFQNTWMRLLERIGGLRDPERLGGWLATTAARECGALRRRGARELPVAETPELAEEDRIADGLLTAERDSALWRAFGTLGEPCQALLRLLVAEPPLSYEEVRETLGLPSIGSIGPTRGRCLDQLRRRIEAFGITAEAGPSLG